MVPVVSLVAREIFVEVAVWLTDSSGAAMGG
jgi:hypothetical protein